MKEQIFTSEFLSKLERLSVHIASSVNFGASGNRKSSAKGMSVEFSDYRDYAPSDDFRRIDWNAYGRFKKLYVKLFMEEKEATIRVIIDNSRSMSYEGKDMMGLRLAGTFSYLALNNLDKVMITPLHSMENNKFLGKGKNSFGHYINYLENISFDYETSSFAKLKPMDFNSRGITVLISDFFTQDDMDDVIKHLAYRKQQVILLHVLSDNELNPTIDGRLKLIDSESGAEKNLVITPTILKRYEETLLGFTNKLKDICYKYGASYIPVNSKDPIEKIILEDLLGTFIHM